MHFAFGHRKLFTLIGFCIHVDTTGANLPLTKVKISNTATVVMIGMHARDLSPRKLYAIIALLLTELNIETILMGFAFGGW
jgi:hypothetical protein